MISVDQFRVDRRDNSDNQCHCVIKSQNTRKTLRCSVGTGDYPYVHDPSIRIKDLRDDDIKSVIVLSRAISSVLISFQIHLLSTW